MTGSRRLQRELEHFANWSNCLYGNAFFWLQKEIELEVRKSGNYVFRTMFVHKIWRYFGAEQ